MNNTFVETLNSSFLVSKIVENTGRFSTDVQVLKVVFHFHGAHCKDTVDALSAGSGYYYFGICYVPVVWGRFI